MRRDMGKEGKGRNKGEITNNELLKAIWKSTS